MFCEVVAEIVMAGGPENVEVTLFDAVSHPIETNIDCFVALLFHRAINNATGG